MATAEVQTTPPTTDSLDPAKGRGVVLYDGTCELCRRSVRSLKRLDWRRRLHFQDCNDTANLPSCEQLLELHRLLEEMHVVTPDRKRALAGFYGFRWIAWRVPVLLPFAPFLYLPGVPWLGRKVYLWVARNRYNLVPCKDGVCSVPLRGQRSEVRDQKSDVRKEHAAK